MGEKSVVQFYCFVSHPPEPITNLPSYLESMDFTVQSENGLADTGCGVLVADNVSPDVLTAVSNHSRNGESALLVVLVGGATVKNRVCWELTDAGAADVLVWEETPQPTLRIAALLKRWSEIAALVRSPLVRSNIIGNSSIWAKLVPQIVETAHFTRSSMVLLGESGTGKELLARLVHALSNPGKRAPLVVVDCTTVVPELSGSEFFGHERGAFTGAHTSRDGAFAAANGGTLFLDEVGELPPTLQAQLLRVIQEKTFKRVGGDQWIHTDFRLICATNRDLSVEVAEGRFRRDLYYRIATHVYRIPPLRERPEDILPLAAFFLREHFPKNTPELTPPMTEYLMHRDYPGNVRDLRQLVARIATKYVGHGPVGVGDLPRDERPHVTWMENKRTELFDEAVKRALAVGMGLKEITKEASETAIRLALGEAGGNLQKAAKLLSVTDRALQMRRAIGSVEKEGG